MSSTARSHTDTLRPFEVLADVRHNRLRAEFRRVVAAKDMRPEIDRLHQVLRDVATGFTLVTDLTELDSMDIECVPHLTRMMDLCLAAGVGQVVRIIPNPDKDIGFGLLSLTHYRGKVPIATFDSRAAAEPTLGAS